MKTHKHGIISIILFFFAIVLGTIAIINISFFIAKIYIILVIVGFLSVIYSYCTKCEARFNCGHVILGKIAKWLPKRKNTNYSFWDYLGVIIPMLIIILYPQVWLWKIKWMFVLFWLLCGISVFVISFYVCTSCKNSKCALCKGKCVLAKE